MWRDQHEKEEPSCHEWSYGATQLLRFLFLPKTIHPSSINAASCTPLLEPFPVVIGRTHRKTNKYFTLTHTRTDNLESTNMQNMPHRKASCSASNPCPSCCEATVLTHCATVSPVCQYVLGQTFNPPNSDTVIQWY